MPKLPQISGMMLVRALRCDGWIEVSQRGSHLKMVKHYQPFGKAVIIVPMHKTVRKGTLSGILKDAKITPEKLNTLI